MKLAEALVRAKDLKGKLTSLHQELSMETQFEQVDKTQEVPNTQPLIDQMISVSEDLRALKTRIDLTNAKSGLADKIHEMEKLRYLVNTLNNLTSLKQEVTHLRRIDFDGPAQPVTTVTTFNVERLKLQLEVYQSSLRTLDLEVQKTNWQIDLE